MEIKHEFKDVDFQIAHFETSLQILAHQKALISLICDNKSKTAEEADALYADVMDDADRLYKEVLADAFARRGNIDLNGLLGKG